jgi:protein Tex
MRSRSATVKYGASLVASCTDGENGNQAWIAKWFWVACLLMAQVTFESWLAAAHPEIPVAGMAAVLRLAGEGATVPFIARYRKEQTGALDEVAIRAVIEGKETWDSICKRQVFIIGEIERQGKLTDELRARIESTYDLPALEDLYLPYKQKRKTKAVIAREAGLEPLANWLWDCGHGLQNPVGGETPDGRASAFISEEKGIHDVDAALAGAVDILIERLSESADLRTATRSRYLEKGFAKTSKGDKAKTPSKFENYFAYEEPVRELLKPENSHRYLAMRRGWMEEELTLHLGGPAPREPAERDSKHPGAPVDPLADELLVLFEAVACSKPDFAGAPLLKRAARFALRAHVVPAIENEVHKALREVADEAAIRVFAENVRKLLLSAPFGPKAVLGVDPGLRTGCKLAVVDDSGKYVGSTVLHLESAGGKTGGASILAELIRRGGIRAVAVGNGTAGREAEAVVRDVLSAAGLNVPVVMVSEAGASVYSASDVAREEFPDLDLTVRGAISIARRLQDPLAELVKVDPKSIGVGQYQHDVSPTALQKSLDAVVDSCVNQVGVNLNTASHLLLAHVSGIGPGLAKAMVEYRGKKGLFKSRQALLDVPRFSPKVFEQAAGFLRIPEAEHPFDNTGVHPERYAVLERLAQHLGVPAAGLLGAGVQSVKASRELQQELGAFTFADVVKELEKPGRDPRETFVPFSYRQDIHTLRDLQAGMVCPGIVTNVTNFGAFVDIGVHQDGLVHISQLADRFVKDPRDVVSPGDRVSVRVLEVKLDKQQIALSMRSGSNAEVVRGPRPSGQERNERPGGQGKSPRGPSAPPPQPSRPFNNPFAGLDKLRGR